MWKQFQSWPELYFLFASEIFHDFFFHFSIKREILTKFWKYRSMQNFKRNLICSQTYFVFFSRFLFEPEGFGSQSEGSCIWRSALTFLLKIITFKTITDEIINWISAQSEPIWALIELIRLFVTEVGRPWPKLAKMGYFMTENVPKHEMRKYSHFYRTNSLLD